MGIWYYVANQGKTGIASKPVLRGVCLLHNTTVGTFNAFFVCKAVSCVFSLPREEFIRRFCRLFPPDPKTHYNLSTYLSRA